MASEWYEDNLEYFPRAKRAQDAENYGQLVFLYTRMTWEFYDRVGDWYAHQWGWGPNSPLDESSSPHGRFLSLMTESAKELRSALSSWEDVDPDDPMNPPREEPPEEVTVMGEILARNLVVYEEVDIALDLLSQAGPHGDVDLPSNPSDQSHVDIGEMSSQVGKSIKKFIPSRFLGKDLRGLKDVLNEILSFLRPRDERLESGEDAFPRGY